VVAGVLFTTLLVLTGGKGSVLHLRETSGSTYFCSGYAGCNAAGYSDSGYGAVSNKMYWRMYPGHNCVNYVAYRMIQAGMPNQRPWTGNGNAANWGHAMASITDQTPAVGAVAWWDAYHHVGSAGHVAYIEKVVSPTDIIISEDSWSGTFHWQEVTKDSGFWPSGFIHFRDKDAGPVLVNKVKPFITGTAQVGQTLAGHVGTWSGKPSSYSYTWTADGVAIPGATSASFAPTSAQVGKQIGLQVTGSHAKSTSVTVAAAPTAAVAKGVFSNAAPPAITGDPIVAHTLTADPGDWSPSPQSYTYNWRADGQPIANATGSTLQLTQGMVGKKITVIAHARAAGFKTATRTSDATAVALGRITVTRPFAITGRPSIGVPLQAQGAFTPADATPSYQWLRAGQPIAGATGATYTPTAADLGHRLSVQVSVNRTNYIAASGSAATSQPVRTPVHVEMHSLGIKGGAVVRIRVTAPGLRPVPGSVLVRVGTERRTVVLTNGTAKVVLTGLAARHYTVRAYFHRNTSAYEANATGGVTPR
jgi:surface antigen